MDKICSISTKVTSPPDFLQHKTLYLYINYNETHRANSFCFVVDVYLESSDNAYDIKGKFRRKKDFELRSKVVVDRNVHINNNNNIKQTKDCARKRQGK